MSHSDIPPQSTVARRREISGLAFCQQMMAGTIAAPPMVSLLGLRLVDGLSESDIHEVPDEPKKKRKAKLPPLIPPSSEVRKRENGERFQSIPDAAKRGSVNTLEKLAAADAFRSLGLDRRQALWEVKALANAPPLPLFSWSETRDTGKEAEVRLPEMALSEHVVNDYQTLRLSLKAHPMSFLREDFRRAGVLSCKELGQAKNGAYVRVAGVVLVRQRPGNGNVVFMSQSSDVIGRSDWAYAVAGNPL